MSTMQIITYGYRRNDYRLWFVFLAGTSIMFFLGKEIDLQAGKWIIFSVVMLYPFIRFCNGIMHNRNMQIGIPLMSFIFFWLFCMGPLFYYFSSDNELVKLIRLYLTNELLCQAGLILSLYCIMVMLPYEFPIRSIRWGKILFTIKGQVRFLSLITG